MSSYKFKPCYDIYSLGATLRFMLTGKDCSSENSISGDSSLPADSCSKTNQLCNVSDATKKCIEKSLSYHESWRQQNVDEFLEMLPYE